MHNALEARPAFFSCQILGLEFKTYVLFSPWPFHVGVPNSEQLSQIFERVWMLLQASSQLWFPRYRFVV